MSESFEVPEEIRVLYENKLNIIIDCFRCKSSEFIIEVMTFGRHVVRTHEFQDVATMEATKTFLVGCGLRMV